MSLLLDYEKTEMTEFPGPDLLTDVGRRGGAILARNTEYLPGQVKTRIGYGEAFNPAGAVSTMYNWVQSLYNRIIYFKNKTDVFSRDIGGTIIPGVVGLEFNIIPNLLAEGLSIAQAGSRIYIASFDAAGRGANPVKVWDGNFVTIAGGSSLPRVENAFQCPLTEAEFTITLSEPAAGTVSAGEHRIGIIFETQNGYQVKPSPGDGGASIDSLSFASIVSSGDKNIRVVLTPTPQWPLWTRFAYVIMTAVDNPNRYFLVPNSKTGIFFGGTTPATIDIDIDDVTLAATSEDVTDRFFLKCGDLKAHAVLEYGSRMVYIVEVFDADVVNSVSTIYVSDPYDYQRITEDRHQIRLPGARRAVTAFVLQNVLYLLGPNWTYATSDNTDEPVQWVPPQLIDGSIGTQSVLGVTTNPAKGFAWVCDQGGLYLFSGGAYPNRPISYYQTPDWGRINWASTVVNVQVEDDSPNRKVHVMAPLDGAVTATHRLTWDYTDGVDPESAKYSIESIQNFNPGSLEMVLNPTSKELELWVGKATAGKVLRRKSLRAGDPELSLYNDDELGIDSEYETPLLVHEPVLSRFCGTHLRVFGNGAVHPSVRSLDGARTLDLVPIAALDGPGKLYLRTFGMNSESCSLVIGNKTIRDAWFGLSHVTLYYDPLWVTQR